MWKLIQPRPGNLRLWQAALLAALLGFWYLMTTPGLVPNFMFDNDRQAAFFFGEPVKVAQRIWAWFVAEADIYRHLAVTLIETLLAFGVGSVLGLACGPVAGAEPDGQRHPRALHQGAEQHAAHHPGAHLQRLVRAGHRQQGGAGRDAGVLHRLLQRLPGREGSQPGGAGQCAHAGRQPRQLLRHVYLPSATSWVFSSLHTSVGLAFVGAVVGEYLGSSQGVGYLILQAEGTFDINTVMAGIVVLTAFALVLDAAGGPHREAADEVAAAQRAKPKSSEQPPAWPSGRQKARLGLRHGQGLFADGGQQPVLQPQHPRRAQTRRGARCWWAGGRAGRLWLAGCAGTPSGGAAASRALGFKPVAASGVDRVVVPEGYTAAVLAPWGEAVGIAGRCRPSSSTPATAPPSRRCRWACTTTACTTTRWTAHAAACWPSTRSTPTTACCTWDGQKTWTPEKVRKAQAAHGITVIEIEQQGSGWQVVRPSRYARRITASTPFAVGGPAAGHPLMKTAADPAGRTVLGTIGNCASGKTPWGTYLSGEENWANYFSAADTPTATRTPLGHPQGHLVPLAGTRRTLRHRAPPQRAQPLWLDRRGRPDGPHQHPRQAHGAGPRRARRRLGGGDAGRPRRGVFGRGRAL
jgi:NitT/TauT family transport system permease protein